MAQSSRLGRSRPTIDWTTRRMRCSSQRASSPCSTESSGRGSDIRARRGDGWPRFDAGPRIALRVWDARVIDASEQSDKGLLYPRQIAQGQIAVIELALLEPLTDDALDQLLDRFARMIA